MSLIALVDVPYALWRHRDALKMTREELRQELRESEGDPQLKARVRSQQRAMARKRMMAAVPKASVVVTNPTHYAVALEYRDGVMRAPRVVAKGVELVAQRIRELPPSTTCRCSKRRRWRVRCIATPSSTRRFRRRSIPSSREVLAYVYQLQQFHARGGAAPVTPQDLDVPADLDPLGCRMNALALRLGFTRAAAVGLAGPLLIVLILGMMVLPLPPFLLDLLFTFNIALAMLVLLAAMYTVQPLDFAVFPTVLLLTTLLRLSLNVASTRVVLLHGHTGADAAGKVIEAFGHFLVGGNFAVGLVVFVILVVINFVVITKGAGRIAEVSARFTLDAMPGKQMAIDADLNAGLIGEDEARRRRAEIAKEADFYGAMDGARKFVRGDAIAGILILFINIVGGLVIGVLQHDLSLSQAANNYMLLTIGDGLVAQIPALVISTAAGLVVSRVGKGEQIGRATDCRSSPRSRRRW